MIAGWLEQLAAASPTALLPLPFPPPAGAIMAPFYQEGISDPKDWPAQLLHPAPWGEIGSSKFDIASPRSSLESVGNPRALMGEYWDRVLDLVAYMANIDPQRPYPQRMQHDVDISIGYMHSGWVASAQCFPPMPVSATPASSFLVPPTRSYPFMTLMDVVDTTLDPSAPKWGMPRCCAPKPHPPALHPLLLCCRVAVSPMLPTEAAHLTVLPPHRAGHYHELGHNHQSNLWTWSCTVEASLGNTETGALAAITASGALLWPVCQHLVARGD